MSSILYAATFHMPLQQAHQPRIVLPTLQPQVKTAVGVGQFLLQGLLIASAILLLVGIFYLGHSTEAMQQVTSFLMHQSWFSSALQL
jgi:hypothetical protein